MLLNIIMFLEFYNKKLGIYYFTTVWLKFDLSLTLACCSLGSTKRHQYSYSVVVNTLMTSINLLYHLIIPMKQNSCLKESIWSSNALKRASGTWFLMPGQWKIFQSRANKFIAQLPSLPAGSSRFLSQTKLKWSIITIKGKHRYEHTTNLQCILSQS